MKKITLDNGQVVLQNVIGEVYYQVYEKTKDGDLVYKQDGYQDNESQAETLAKLILRG
jgi:hypothetical protein